MFGKFGTYVGEMLGGSNRLDVLTPRHNNQALLFCEQCTHQHVQLRLRRQNHVAKSGVDRHRLGMPIAHAETVKPGRIFPLPGFPSGTAYGSILSSLGDRKLASDNQSAVTLPFSPSPSSGQCELDRRQARRNNTGKLGNALRIGFNSSPKTLLRWAVLRSFFCFASGFANKFCSD